MRWHGTVAFRFAKADPLFAGRKFAKKLILTATYSFTLIPYCHDSSPIYFEGYSYERYSTWFHARRVVGGDCNHWGLGGIASSRGPSRSRSSQKDAVSKLHSPNGTGGTQF
jgi:hypothetical protein